MSYKLSIVFYVNGMPFDGDTLKKESLGGSESAGLYMAREMAKRGHYVTVFSNTDKIKSYDGVVYQPLGNFPQYAANTDIDVLIGQRIPEVFANNPATSGYRGQPYKSKLNILWQHDLALKRNRPTFLGSSWNIDEIWGVSEYHIEQIKSIMGIDEGIRATRNGIDKIKLKSVKRNPKRLIYTSRPERGMDTLLHDIMPRLWAKDPEIELHIAGYDNVVPQMKSFYDSLNAKIVDYQKQGFKVKHLGALTKDKLYKEYQEAALYVYPTNFEEVSCITAMECMACGLPMVTTALAALPETLKSTEDYNTLIEGDAKSKEYQDQFIDTVLDSLKSSEETHQSKSDWLVNHSKNFTWESLAEDWENRILELFKERITNKDALAKQFYRNEDIMAVLALDIPEWNERIAKEYPIIEDKDIYRDTYIEQGKHFKEILADTDQLQLVPYSRVQIAIDELKGCKNILDYGGAWGNEAMQMVNQLDCKVTTINIVPDEQDIGKAVIDRLCNKPKNIDWITAENPNEIKGGFDGAFCGEILEHIAIPEEFVDEIERKVNKGSRIIFTVPSGPWGDTNDLDAYKGHLWSYNHADLQDLFRDKKGLKIATVSGGVNAKNKERLGWYVISYINSDAKTGSIDMGRKLAIQAPRQTVSACMIVGGKQEGLLHRCLDSIHHLVDEIIIADTGMSTESRNIIDNEKYYKIRVIENAPNPLEEGFDEARNFSIKEASSDWILWIDSDEEVQDYASVFKYLRANMFNGYAIRQHHFCIEPNEAAKVDLPVRLFRNGKDIKFFGVVHEHPETGLNNGVGAVTALGDINIAHDGYLTEDVRRARFSRNYGLMVKDREKYPDRLLGKFLWIRDSIHMARYLLEQTNGQVTPEIQHHCQVAIDMYKEDFLTDNNIFSQDGLSYYGEALKILGKGMEYSFALGINAEPQVMSGRFETKEDFVEYMNAKVEAMNEPFEGLYV